MPDRDALEALLRPKSIAVVGASPRTRMGLAVLDNSRKIGLSGAVMPVNPNYPEIDGFKCYPSLAELPTLPDCVVILVPARAVIGVLEEAGKLGIRSAIVIANGFGDAQTEEGHKLQARLVETADRYRMAVAGPNCLGLSSVVYRFANTYTDLPEGVRSGGVSLISQSGGLMNAAASYLHDRGGGLNYLISGGNHAVVDIPDYIDFLSDDPQTRVIAIIMEGVKDGRRFRAAIERASPKKPIVILKLGRSESGQRATLAHTGTLAGQHEAYAALFRQNGVLQAVSTDDLMETALLFSLAKPPTGDRALMFTISGGTTGLIGDIGEAAGLRFPPLSEATDKALQKVFKVDKAFNNPIDTTGWPQLTDEGNLDRALDVMLADDNVDLIAMVFRLTPSPRHVELLRNFADRAKASAKPIIFTSTVTYTAALFREAAPDLNDFPILEDLERGQRAIARLVSYGLYLQKLKTAQPRIAVEAAASAASGARTSLIEFESKAVLARFGLPVTQELLARTADEAAQLSAQIGYPVALKIQSPDVPHKSDAGGVVLNVRSAGEAQEAFGRIIASVAKAHPHAAVDGVLVQEMVPPGVEMILGMNRDEQLGPIIVCGLGGIFVEVLKDVALRFPPLDQSDARAMLKEIKGAKLLEGYRGAPPCDVEALIETLVAFGRMVAATDGQYDAIDINPLIVGPVGRGVKVADAVIIPAGAKTGH